MLQLRRSVLAIAVVAGTATLLAQRQGIPPARLPPPQQTPTFRSRINLVPVDVRVTDASGKPVTDLTQSDFTVLENNVRQEIRHFSTTALRPEPPVPGQSLLRTAETPELGTQNHRVFLIVLGRGRLQDVGKGIDGAIDLVKKYLLPQDYVGVMSWNRATDLTTEHDRILAVLERFKKGHEKVESLLRQHFSGLTAIYGGATIPAPVQKEIDAIFKGPGAPGVREIPPGQVAQANRIADDTRRTTGALQTQAINNEATAAGRTPMTSLSDTASLSGMDMSLDEFAEVNSQSMQDLATLYTGISYLRHVTGEKNLLLVSERGLMLPRAEDDRGIAAAAADARVALSILHTGGMPAPLLPNGRGVRTAPSVDWRMQTSRTVAELSGGQFTSLQVGPQFVARLDELSRFQYTLGYYPANAVMDGRYRRITVRVRPGLRVSYRHGYYARQFQAGFDRLRMVAYSRITAAASYAGEVRDLPITLEAKLDKDASGGRVVVVTAKISAERLSLKDADGRRKGSIEVAVFCADGNERLVGLQWDTAEFEMTPDAYERFIKSGLTYNNTVQVSADPRNIKIVVYDAGADLVGSAMLKIK